MDRRPRLRSLDEPTDKLRGLQRRFQALRARTDAPRWRMPRRSTIAIAALSGFAVTGVAILVAEKFL